MARISEINPETAPADIQKIIADGGLMKSLTKK